MSVIDRNAANSPTIEVRFPFTGEKVGEVHVSSPSEIDRIIEMAHDAYINVWRHSSPFDRATLLHQIAEAVASDEENMARLITLESGKVIRESRAEVRRAVTTLTTAAEEAKRINGEILPCDVSPAVTGKTALAFREPVGVVGAITPFNFPLNTIAHKVGPALAGGNSVVLKPSPRTPLTAERVHGIFEDCCSVPEVFGLIQGGGEAGERLSRNSLVRVVSLTGRTSTGRRVASLGGIKKLLLELGGNDPLIVCADADLDAAAAAAVEHGLLGAGQRCTAVKRVYIEKRVLSPFTERLLERTRSLKAGDPLEESTDIGPLIDVESAKVVEDRVRDAVRAGAVLVHGDERQESLFFPTILQEVPEHCALVKEETLGPVLPLKSFTDVVECVRIINGTRFGLQAGVFTSRMDTILMLRRELQVGALVVNSGPGFRVESLPFGGVKDSGLGREGVRSAIREMTEDRLLIM